METTKTWYERFPARVTEFFSSWTFLAGLNFVMGIYVEYNNLAIHPFDVFPYELLNLILGWLMADMTILILIATRAGARADAKQALYTLDVMESVLSVLKTLRDMQDREADRDKILHSTISEIHALIRDRRIP